MSVANEPRFASVPPARMVPMLADEVMCLGSESSMARVLREHGRNTRRGHAKTPKATRPSTTHIATAPGQVWCWDMAYLPANVMGRWVPPVPDPGPVQPQDRGCRGARQ